MRKARKDISHDFTFVTSLAKNKQRCKQLVVGENSCYAKNVAVRQSVGTHHMMDIYPSAAESSVQGEDKDH